MQQTLDLMILGGKRYDIDGNKVCNVFAYTPYDEDDHDAAGMDVFKMSAPSEIIEILRKYQDKLPALFTCKVVIKSSGGKGTFHLKELKATGQVKAA
jgi:hypothetical protein